MGDFFAMVHPPLVVQGLLILEASRLHLEINTQTYTR